MPRYFFVVQKDGRTPDTTGIELPDQDAAHREAIQCLAEEMRDNPGQLWNDAEWRIEVTDESGLILFTVYSAAMGSSAVPR